MGRYVFKRLLQGIIAIVILISIVFILARMTGNPVDLMLPPDATEQDRIEMIERLGLDRPYAVQYIEFMLGAVRGDLGESIRFKIPAIELYFQRLPNSLILNLVAFVWAVTVAIPLGIISGSSRGSFVDSLCRVLAVIGVAAPSFWVALVLMQIFAVQLGLLPSARMGGPSHFVLPALSSSFFMLAGMMRLLRSSMIEVMDSEFVKLARIKGVSNRMVIWKHCFRNSLIPVLTFAGMYLGMMIGSGVVIETIFAWPGAGRLTYEGIINRDYPVVQAVVLMHGVLIVFINFLIDILYSYVDPRIRRE